MVRNATVATCALNQWALDFEGNYARILQSIGEAKAKGARLRVGSELEVCGYGCQDHFFELDTFEHSFEVLGELLKNEHCRDIVIMLGLPVMHRSTGYNCVVVVFNGKILLIRPKQAMCDGGNYRESRWFCAWTKRQQVDEYTLPNSLRDITGQRDVRRCFNQQDTVPFGDAVLELNDGSVGLETCEELWVADSPHTAMSLDGVEVICNASASHHELRKSAFQLNSLIRASTEKHGGVYVYANQRGCDGDRLYYDGNATVALNGCVVARGRQFALCDVEVIAATVDLDAVSIYRNQWRSSRRQAAAAISFPRIRLHFNLCAAGRATVCDAQTVVCLPTAEEEIALGPACWLWDYLRRSGQKGFFLPLSGGRDSAAVACLVYVMCGLVCEALDRGDERVMTDLRRVTGEEAFRPRTAAELCSKILFTCYMGTENSSAETRERAAALAAEIGAQHKEVGIDSVVGSMVGLFRTATGSSPRFRVHGGTDAENLALQNVQARMRMVLSYLMAQLSLWSSDRVGSLLVLATSNVDEGLRGYLTKYDCSSADLNPIGSISKMDLDRFLRYCITRYSLASLHSILDAPPTAELEPLDDGKLVQTDEVRELCLLLSSLV